MFPAIAQLAVTSDGLMTVIGTAAGSVPATARKCGGMAVASAGGLYVIYV